MPQNEDALIRRAQAGDTQAFAGLVLAHQDFVYNLALRSLGDPQEAEDLAQDAFLRAWQALPRFQRRARFRTWLYRIVTNLCYNRLPRLKRELQALGDDAFVALPAPPSGDPHTSLEAAERRAYLHQQIDALPESYHLLITLRYQMELPYAEIAEITGLPLGSVKTGLHRARQRLRQALNAYEELALCTTS